MAAMACVQRCRRSDSRSNDLAGLNPALLAERSLDSEHVFEPGHSIGRRGFGGA